MQRYWGVGLRPMNGERGGTVQPLTPSMAIVCPLLWGELTPCQGHAASLLQLSLSPQADNLEQSTACTFAGRGPICTRTLCFPPVTVDDAPSSCLRLVLLLVHVTPRQATLATSLRCRPFSPL